jgi:hypothetical protein
MFHVKHGKIFEIQRSIMQQIAVRFLQNEKSAFLANFQHFVYCTSDQYAKLQFLTCFMGIFDGFIAFGCF